MAPYQKTNACGLPNARVACLAVARQQGPPLPFGLRRDSLRSLRARRLVGLGRLELPTSRLSSARSNQLSYKPLTTIFHKKDWDLICSHACAGLEARRIAQAQPWRVFVREERETKTAKSRQCSSTILTTIGH